MEFIFYTEAAALLDVSVGVLKQAISDRKILTKAGHQGRNTRLIKEQVMLFTGINPRTGNRKRLSFESLTPAEQEQWKRYDAEINHGAATLKSVEDEAMREVETARTAWRKVAERANLVLAYLPDIPLRKDDKRPLAQTLPY